MNALVWQAVAFVVGACWLAVLWAAVCALFEHLDDRDTRRQFRGPCIPAARPTVRRVPR